MMRVYNAWKSWTIKKTMMIQHRCSRELLPFNTLMHRLMRNESDRSLWLKFIFNNGYKNKFCSIKCKIPSFCHCLTLSLILLIWYEQIKQLIPWFSIYACIWKWKEQQFNGSAIGRRRSFSSNTTVKWTQCNRERLNCWKRITIITNEHIFVHSTELHHHNLFV